MVTASIDEEVSGELDDAAGVDVSAAALVHLQITKSASRDAFYGCNRVSVKFNRSTPGMVVRAIGFKSARGFDDAAGDIGPERVVIGDPYPLFLDVQHAPVQIQAGGTHVRHQKFIRAAIDVHCSSGYMQIAVEVHPLQRILMQFHQTVRHGNVADYPCIHKVQGDEGASVDVVETELVVVMGYGDGLPRVGEDASGGCLLESVESLCGEVLGAVASEDDGSRAFDEVVRPLIVPPASGEIDGLGIRV